MNLKEKKLFLLDMDGTVYRGNALFDETPGFLDFLKKTGRRYIFFTNNSSKSRSSYVEKLKKLGIESSESDFVTSADVTEIYLLKKQYKKIYVFGTKSLARQLASAGLNVTTVISEDIDCLCIGFDTELTFQKIEDACILLKRGVDFVATHPDLTCPTEYGCVPDCGAVCEMLFNATGRRPKVIGKPESNMPLLAMKRCGCTSEETAIVGDWPYTDLLCGNNSGITSIFVLSGDGKLSDLEKSGAKPDFIYNSIKDIHKELL